jgi:uncharacterized protein YndB with AHSA1/START domain
MKTLREEIEINVAPDRVWAVLGDVASAHRYVPGIASSRLEGATRICVTADGQEIHEAISERSDNTRSYRYQHVKTPMPVKLSRGQFTVQPMAGGARSRVTVEAELEALAPEMEGGLTEMMGMGLKQTLANLRSLVQTSS